MVIDFLSEITRLQFNGKLPFSSRFAVRTYAIEEVFIFQKYFIQ